MINFSFLSKASWCFLEGSGPIEMRVGDVMRPTWRADWSTRGGDQSLPFYRRPHPIRLATGQYSDSARTQWTVYYTNPLDSTVLAIRRCMAPYSCIMMNPIQGSPTQDTKPAHPKEETDTEGEELQPKDMTTDKGYKSQRSSLPFSVESLISKTTTCRTSFSSSDLGVVHPTPVAVQSAQFSPRTFYAERKVPAESSQSASNSPNDDSPQFCEKDQSTWFQTSSFSTPPRKSIPLKLLEHLGFIL